MKPNFNVEFMAKAGGHYIKEESVAFHSPEELFRYVSPGGGCEQIPDDIDEIQMVFLPHHERQLDSRMDEVPVTLEMGMVFFTGTLTDIVQMSQLLLGKASRGELSHAFLKIIGVNL